MLYGRFIINNVGFIGESDIKVRYLPDDYQASKLVLMKILFKFLYFSSSLSNKKLNMCIWDDQLFEAEVNLGCFSANNGLIYMKYFCRVWTWDRVYLSSDRATDLWWVYLWYYFYFLSTLNTNKLFLFSCSRWCCFF